jgi:hypothetical protein
MLFLLLGDIVVVCNKGDSVPLTPSLLFEHLPRALIEIMRLVPVTQITQPRV